MIYFDNSATSFNKPISVKKAVCFAMERLTANPGRSGHDLSIEVGQMVFETRELVKKFFNAQNHQMIFTKNCTEALNLALFGSLKSGDHVITSCYEHNSVLRPLERVKAFGVEQTILDCDLMDFHLQFEGYIRPNTKMVAITGMSNVTGESPNLEEIGAICKKHGLIFLVDGAQSSGHLKIDLQKMNIDMYAFAGHKGLYAPTGIGGLIVSNRLNLEPLLFGGTGSESNNLNQPTDFPEGFEAGTLPTIAISGLKAGVEFVEKNFEKIIKIEENLSKYMQNRLKNIKNLKIYSSNLSKNVFSFNIPQIDSSVLADILNKQYSICVRAGLHCAPLVHKKLGSLKTGAVRLSLDFYNTKQEIDYFIQSVEQIVESNF